MLPRRKPNRLPGYDYSLPGEYFVTICTQDRIEWFGQVQDDLMILNDIGRVAKSCWCQIPNHFPNVKLDEFVVMPNHVHGILEIDVGPNIVRPAPVGTADLRSHRTGNVSVGNAYMRSLPRTKMCLPKIVHGFKSAVSRVVRAKLNHPDFAWQKSYYDHIIRDDDAYQKIRDYVRFNPVMWGVGGNNI